MYSIPSSKAFMDADIDACVSNDRSSGTPNGIYCGHECEPDTLILWYRFDKYELNHRRYMPEIPKCLSKRCKGMIWLIILNTAKRPSKVSAVNVPLSTLRTVSLCDIHGVGGRILVLYFWGIFVKKGTWGTTVLI